MKNPGRSEGLAELQESRMRKEREEYQANGGDTWLAKILARQAEIDAAQGRKNG